MGAGTDTVLREDHDGVCLLTLHRPERDNAWTLELEERYFELLTAAAADSAVRVIVLTGAGRAFCSGADPDTLHSVASGGEFSLRARVPQIFTSGIPKPMVAAINGACAGVGLVQALQCDVRFMARAAKLATGFSRLGLPAENAVAWLLNRLAGAAIAADLLLSGRPVAGDEAAALGVVNRVLEPEELLPAALAYAREIADRCAPRSMADVKRQLRVVATMSIEEAFLDSQRAFEEFRDHPDFKEGVKSFLERRLPSFVPVSAEPDPKEISR